MTNKKNTNSSNKKNEEQVPQTQEELENMEVDSNEVAIGAAPQVEVEELSEREQLEQEESREEEDVQLREAPRDVKYEAIRTTEIPESVQRIFAEHGWNIRFVRWMKDGDVDTGYLAKRMNEDKYEFVTSAEVPNWYLSFFDKRDLKEREGCLTFGDLVLMKNPMVVKQQRQKHVLDDVNAELEAANVHTYASKKGFVDMGSRSSVNHREPRFGE